MSGFHMKGKNDETTKKESYGRTCMVHNYGRALQYCGTFRK